MSWRTVVVRNKCKLSYKNGYMIIRNEDINMIHISEIGTLLIDTTMVSITSYLLSELVKNKVKVIFCDEDRNPVSELVGYYDKHNTSKMVLNQTEWKDEIKILIWKELMYQKIRNQNNMLMKYGLDDGLMLQKYLGQLELGDITNREGLASKYYFSKLFGNDFTREDMCEINAALNYGYTILLSTVNKEVVCNGFITQLGIKHKNEFNYFNLSCDLMEPFRVIVDEYVYNNLGKTFDKDYKIRLIDLLNKKINISGKEQFLTNAIKLYVKNILDILSNYKIDELMEYEF